MGEAEVERIEEVGGALTILAGLWKSVEKAEKVRRSK
jgi:hypothetical protein